MTRATRSWLSVRDAATARFRMMLACIVLLAIPGAANAEASGTLVIVPIECEPFFELRGDSSEGWNRWLSFAACTQDASVGEIHDADELPGLVGDLQASLAPTLELYLAAVQRGPRPVKIRAAFQMAMTQVSLITRARSSIESRGLWTDPHAVVRFEQLHAELEPLLEEPAFLAWTLLNAIDRTVTEEVSLAPDPVTRNMVRRARELARELGESWSFPQTPEMQRLADPRSPRRIR